ncbi:2-hydroxyacyl-CoA lyase 2 isoform X2 [Zonotrichia albicollis]|uniref:2-hydroxyacyl-CoA lyase 2 isoform X2 n=1 Tax=Zonotrichia albicollis TaxID=44394 RepID=UPI003D810FA7
MTSSRQPGSAAGAKRREGGGKKGPPAMDLVTILVALVALVAVVVLVVAQRLGLLYRLRHKVDTASPRHGGELVAAVLRAHGVRFLFTLPGGHISPVLVACEKIGIRVVDTRHEATAVFAADAVSRISGRIGVAAVTAGPGVTNALTAVKNAQLAESPLLLLGGAAASLQKGRGALQDIPQLPLFRTVCKLALSVRAVRDIVPALRRAIAAAMGGTPGPVFVELPIDVLYPFHVVQKELGGSRAPRGLRGKLVQWYLWNYLCDLFAGAWEPRELNPLGLSIPRASAQQVQAVSELLSRAQRPLLLVGSQALLPPTPAEELSAALQALGLPCYLGGAARGLLPPQCPLLLRQNRRDALRDADLVLLAGTVCDFRLSYGRLFGRGTAVVAVNRNREQLLRNSDVFWKPRLAVLGDPASLLVALSRSLPGLSCPRPWLQRLREAEEEKERQNRAKAAVPPPCHLNPLALLRALDRLLPPHCLLVADGGDFVGTAAYTVRPRQPRGWMDPGVGPVRGRLPGLQPDGVRHLRAPQGPRHRPGWQRRRLDPDQPRAAPPAGQRRGLRAGLQRLPQGGRSSGRARLHPGQPWGQHRGQRWGQWRGQWRGQPWGHRGQGGGRAEGSPGRVPPRPPRARQRPPGAQRLPAGLRVRLRDTGDTKGHQCHQRTSECHQSVTKGHQSVIKGHQCHQISLSVVVCH